MKRFSISQVGFMLAASAASATIAQAGGLQNGWRAFKDPTIQDHGYQWATVGHAGNADWVGLNTLFQTVRTGGVDYRYRIAKTEVTNRQWLEFVEACAPFLTNSEANSVQFRGTGIGLSGGGGYSLSEENAELAARAGWRYAARYANWLHNDKVNEAWAFESGVYDVDTFGGGGGANPVTDQRERSEGARYFIPTLDEWNKAVHFDPNRFGEGQEGYWLYTYSSNTAPVAGAPGTPGAQTNAGTFVIHPVLSYPDATTPWGLWDASGSAREWLEDLGSDQTQRLAASTDETSIPFGQFDRISQWGGGSISALIGIRLGSVIPGPGTPLVALAFGLGLLHRRRHACLDARVKSCCL